MIRLGLFIAAYSFLLFTNPAFSHQEKAAITQVLVNERSGHLEAAHRFYIHDAEHAVKLITGKSADIFESQETQKSFYDYVISHFSLYVDEQPLELNAIGFEIEGLFFWAYQEIPFNQALLNNKEIGIRHSSLQEFWPDQIDTVNFESGNGQIETAVFPEIDIVVRLKF